MTKDYSGQTSLLRVVICNRIEFVRLTTGNERVLSFGLKSVILFESIEKEMFKLSSQKLLLVA